VTSRDIICNGGPNPLKQPFSSKIIQVRGGDTVGMVWHHSLQSTPGSDKSNPIDPSHLGPTLAYMAKVNSALTTNVTGLRWFKVQEDGMDAQGKWGVSRMYANQGKVSFKVPTCIPSGE
jgi:Auxiliary Activity family 9 (formerly GH61)